MITIEDLVKYGLARDVKPLKETALAQKSAQFQRQIDRLNRTFDEKIDVLQQAGKGQSAQAKSLQKSYGKELSKIEKAQDLEIGRVESKFSSETERYNRLLERPETIRKVSDFRTAEQQKELSRIKGEKETIQRGVAERRAAKIRARGGRSGRQMLSSARLSPESAGVGGQSTLGEAPFLN